VVHQKSLSFARGGTPSNSIILRNGGEQRNQTVARMTHRHFAIFRTRVKPYRVYNSSGPVCR